MESSTPALLNGGMSTAAPTWSGKRVGLVAVGDPRDANVWSGTPAGLLSGLTQLGASVVPINAAPPTKLGNIWARICAGETAPTLEKLVQETRHSTEYGRIYSAMAQLRLPKNVDAVLQLGTGYRVRHANVGTFEDMTVPQAVRYGWGPFATLPSNITAGRLARQKEAHGSARICFAATSWAAQSIVDECNVHPNKVHVAGLGINRTPSHPQDRDWSTPHFLFVGNDWERKNGQSVVDAFQIVQKSHPLAQLSLVGENQPRISHPGVHQFGPLPLNDEQAQNTLKDLFRRATCLVLPSRLEPAGLVYAEAGSFGVPSIGTTIGGAGDMIGPGGILVNPFNTRDLTDAMFTMSRPAVVQNYGVLAEKHSANLTWKSVAETILQNLLPPSHRHSFKV
ncbi:Glycosyl transferases group 1 [Micrococcus terreus]|uniref:Glycosyl transferases group 1 n=2 Tax=Micrococcus terreus TaxID=574650 RepID=A0A1I7MPG1_9MICC|nr:Glycosyl transferases group 1 [Micrococcus terreus]